MFDNFRAMQAFAELMRNRDALKDAGERIRRRLEETRAEGEAGSGAVRVTATGKMRIERVHVEPALAAGMASDDRTREMAEGLITEAANAALERVQDAAREAIEEEIRAMGLPAELAERFGGMLP